MQLSGTTKPTVLLVEADNALRRLIALGLLYRGIDVIEASSLDGLPLASRRPDLLLLDIDGRGKNELSALLVAQTALYLATLPVIVLAWEDEVEAQEQLAAPFPVTYLPKPFDARTLHATISQILAENVQQETAYALAHAASMHEARAGARPAPTLSIWPLITAAGLFLSFIGLMGLLALTGFGLLIVFASLLLWTLGAKAEQAALPVA